MDEFKPTYEGKQKVLQAEEAKARDWFVAVCRRVILTIKDDPVRDEINTLLDDIALETRKGRKMTKPKILVLGYARHGKDTVGEILRDNYGFKFTSSSMFVGQECLWDNWGVAKYPDFEAMYEDRSNHRVLWMEMISAYNTPDKSKTAATMIERGFDLYVGMRRLDELEACKQAGIFDHIIWVDASKRHPPETGSMDITAENANADFWIDNNGPEEDLFMMVADVMQQLCLNQVKGSGIWTPQSSRPADDPDPKDAGDIFAELITTTLDDLLAAAFSVGGTVEIFFDTPVDFHHGPEFILDEDMIDRIIRASGDPVDLKATNCFVLPEDEEADELPESGLTDYGKELFGAMPSFKSTRTKVGELEVVETEAEGVTTIINIENFYMVQDDD